MEETTKNQATAMAIYVLYTMKPRHDDNDDNDDDDDNRRIG